MIDLNKCKPGDKLVCRDGMVLEYLRITSVSARFRHIAGNGSIVSYFTDDGRYLSRPHQHHMDIVRIEHQAPAEPKADSATLFLAEKEAYRQTLDHLRAVTKSLTQITAERDALRDANGSMIKQHLLRVAEAVAERDRLLAEKTLWGAGATIRVAIAQRDEARAELTRVCAAYEKVYDRIEGLLGEINKLAQEHKAKASDAESGLAAVRAERDALAEGVRLLREQAQVFGHDGGATIRDQVRAWERKHGHLA